jgi:hypothetical protein
MTTLVFALTLALLLGTSASAQELITQARAEAGGITRGDAPGFPVTITKAGTYRLGGVLEVPETLAEAGIEVVVDDVTIDLNGFGMSTRPIEFAGAVLFGIRSTANRTTVLNGSLFDFQHGIDLRPGRGHRVERMHLFNMDGRGIQTGPNSHVAFNIIVSSEDAGLNVGEGSLVIGNIVNESGDGVLIAPGSTIVQNVMVDTGLSFGDSTSGYSQNVLLASPVGGTPMGPNLCQPASDLCP